MHRCVLAVGLTAMTYAASGAGAQVTVGPNVHVSAARADQAHGEVLIAAHPTDRDRLLGCSMVISEEAPVTRWTTAYASVDGGQSWRPTLETKERLVSGDPACVFGTGGAAYFTNMAWPDHDDDLRYEVQAYRSRDDGRTWSAPSVVARQFDHLDREFVVVDNGPASPYRGRVYVHAQGSVRHVGGKRVASAVKLYRSLDGGATFLGPMELASDGGDYMFGSGNNTVLGDGTIAIVFPEIKEYWKADGTGGWRDGTPDQPNMQIKVVTSSDGGESLNPAVTVSDQVDTKNPATAGVPYIAADPGSPLFKDRLYVVWHDERSGRSEIYLAYSADKGKTWSMPRRVNDDGPSAAPAGPDHFMPVVAVNRDGVVGVSWYDRRAHADNLGWDVRFAASLDGGDTFGPSVVVSAAGNRFGKDERWVMQVAGMAKDQRTPHLRVFMQGFTWRGGDTGGLTADAAGRFHPFWIDNRTGLPQVWTAAVTVSAPVARYGSPALDSLEDLSTRVRLEVMRVSYDRKANALSVTARLRNVSADTLLGPFVTRALTLGAAFGTPEVVNADSRDRGRGARWTLRSADAGGRLAPKGVTEPKELRFQHTNLLPFRKEKGFRSSAIDMELQVLGGLVPAAPLSAARQ